MAVRRFRPSRTSRSWRDSSSFLTWGSVAWEEEAVGFRRAVALTEASRVRSRVGSRREETREIVSMTSFLGGACEYGTQGMVTHFHK